MARGDTGTQMTNSYPKAPSWENKKSRQLIRKKIMANKKMTATVDHGYSWVVMFSTFMLFCLFSGNFTAHGVFLPEFVDYFRVSKAEAAVAGSLTVGIAGIIGIVLGPLIKRYGARTVVMCGGLLGGIGVSAASLANNLEIINILLGVFPGIGYGCFVIGGTVATLEYFHQRRALAFGVAATGLSAGTFVSPLITRLLVEQYGWRGALLVQGGILLNGIVCGALLRPQVKHMDEEDDQRNSGWKERLMLVFDFTVFRDAKYSLYIISTTLNKSAHVVPFLFLPARAISLGSSKMEAVTLVTVMGICSCIFRPIFGFCGDHLSVKRTLCHSIAGALSGTLHVISYFFVDYTAMAVYSAVVGALSAGYIAMENAVLGDIVPDTKHAHATGIYMFSYGVGCLLTPPVAGILVDITGNFGTPFLLVGIAQITSGICSSFIYMLQCKRTEVTYDEAIDINAESPEQNGTVKMKC